MRQLYIACIVSIADFGVPIWWNNQKFLLDKYQKLQNLALRRILGAFKTSPIITMELEAAIPPPKVRFQKICMNYSLRIMQLFKNHPIRTRVSTSFPPYNNGNELDWDKYLDWNEKEQDKKDLEITELDSDSQQEQRHRKKRRKVKRKKKIVSQLFRITSNIFDLLPSLKIEKIKQKWSTSWSQNLSSLIDIQISELDKEKTAILHHEKVQKILSKNQDNSNMILYSDGSKNEQLNKVGAGVFYTINFVKNQSFSWNLESGVEVFNAELFAIKQAFKIAWQNKQLNTDKVWIFSDSQAAIKRLKKSNLKAGQYYVQLIKNWTKKFQDIAIQLHLE